MTYATLDIEQKEQLKNFLKSFNKLLQENNLSLETPVTLANKYYGVLGDIEHGAGNLYLIDPETLVEYESTEE